ncbi:MAG TPA: ATP-binding protein [Polyangiales bacterium]|nr:ATP-binding protein [Polyangiales bacterium]
MTAARFTGEDVSGLIRAVQRLSAARDLASVVEVVRTSARGLLGADGVTFVLREGDQVFYVAEDAISPLWQGKRFPVSECISGWVMQQRQVVTIRDVYEDPRVPQLVYRPTFVRSLAMVPVNREDPIAAIGAYWAECHDVNERELELLSALADATSTAIENSNLYRGLLAARSDLEHASTRLRLALEAGAIGTWEYDPRGDTLACDPTCRALLNLPPTAALDRARFTAQVHVDDRPAVNAALDAALAPGSEGHYDVEYRVGSEPDGVRWLAARGRVQFGAEGEAVRFVGLVRDISDEKLAEAEKAELLRRANAANTAKDEFLAMLGHELRNPLAPILTAVELMEMHGNRSREVLTIERQCKHLTRLVDDLLDISRVTRGKLELKVRNGLALGAIAAEAIEMAAPLIERRRHVLEVELEPDIRLDGDEFRLAQLLANLLTNAAKYTPDSGLIRIEAHTSDGQVLLTVRDNGCGITPELLPQLFAPFVQATQSSERSMGGLGLGLAIARNLAELHGGSIRAESPGRGQGSAFTLQLPLGSAPSSLTPTAAEPVEQQRRKELVRLLVVDDNQDAAELLASSLRKRGYLVRVALDPVEALETVRIALPDVAIMDIGLPVMDGYELAKKMHAEWGERCPMLIAITGYGQEQDRRKSAAVGFAQHLVKPVQTAVVLGALAEVVPRCWRRRSGGAAAE